MSTKRSRARPPGDRSDAPPAFAAYIGSAAHAEHLRRVSVPIGDPRRRLCGAKTRAGTPCAQIGMENGRCRLHGGLTPKGENWHRVQWPDPADPNAERKSARKLRTIEKRVRKRGERLADMTDEERAAYEARWAHKANQRAQKRADAFRQRQLEAKAVIDEALSKAGER